MASCIHSFSPIAHRLYLRLLPVLLALCTSALAFCQTQKEPYVLGPEDVVTLTILRHPEWSGDILIPADGVVDLPFAGPTKAAGLTMVELRKIVISALGKRVYNPEAVVLLKIPRTRRVYVEGSVALASALDYKPGWRISECLAEAGGLAQGVQPIDCKVTVLRGDTGKVEQVSLTDVLAGLPAANLTVAPGDVVTVVTLQTIPVYVVGQVTKPGAYAMRADNTGLMSALALAGGLLPTAATGSVTITHLNGYVKKFDLSRVVLYGDKVDLPELHSGDLVSVPELQARFAIAGLVKLPGVFPIADGKIIRLSDAISLAGGHDTKRARLSRVAVLRNDKGKMKRMIVNYGRFLDKGDATQNLVLQADDVIYVPETDSVDWNVVFNGLISSYYVLTGIRTISAQN